MYNTLNTILLKHLGLLIYDRLRPFPGNPTEHTGRPSLACVHAAVLHGLPNFASARSTSASDALWRVTRSKLLPQESSYAADAIL